MAKPASRVREVEVPHAAEQVVEADGVDFVGVRVEALLPAVQRARVVVAEVEALGDPQVGVLADAVVDRPHRRQRAAREDVLGDPGVLMAGRDHPRVVEHDGLEPDPTVGRDQPIERGEVGRPVALADRFDHLDAHDRVVLALGIAVVAQLHVDAIADARRRRRADGRGPAARGRG